jgi:hypothetical protein
MLEGTQKRKKTLLFNTLLKRNYIWGGKKKERSNIAQV